MKNLIFKFLPFVFVFLLAVVTSIAFNHISIDLLAAGVTVGMFGMLPTAQEKIVRTNQNLGNNSIGKMQGSSVVLFDSLPITATGNQTLKFFDGVAARLFPLSNVNSNVLPVGMSVAFQRMSIGLFSYNPTTAAVGNPMTFGSQWVGTPAATGFAGLYLSQVSIDIGQSEVIKPIPLLQLFASFNKAAQFASGYTLVPATPTGRVITHDVFYFDTNLVLPPQIEFNVTVRTPVTAGITIPGSEEIRMFVQIDGVGSLLNPRSNF